MLAIETCLKIVNTGEKTGPENIIFQVFVVGSHTSGLPFMSAVIHPLFELFCFVRKRVSHLRYSKYSVEVLSIILVGIHVCVKLKFLNTCTSKCRMLCNFLV